MKRVEWLHTLKVCESERGGLESVVELVVVQVLADKHELALLLFALLPLFIEIAAKQHVDLGGE